MFRKGIKYFLQYTYRPLLMRYLAKSRTYTYEGIKINILPGVFHPAFFFSTKFLLTELKTENIGNKKILELGAGSGLISFYAAKQGAIVTASDISKIAIEGLNLNLSESLIDNQQSTIDNSGVNNQQSTITIIHSNLFTNIPPQTFDYIIINPPYYPKDPKNDPEKAWFCGKNFEYFEQLFKQLPSFTHTNSEVWLSLSEDCDLAGIREIAARHGLFLEVKRQKKIVWEQNYIFLIKPISSAIFV